MSALWNIQLFGTLRLQNGPLEITRFRTQKTGALLAYLVCSPEQAQPREVLIETFWPEGSLEAGRQSLRMALSSLRHQLEPPPLPSNSVLYADRQRVQIVPGSVSADVLQFEAMLQRAGQTSDRMEKRRLLSEALVLYTGPLLPGVYEPWVLPRQLCLEDLYAQASLQLIALLEAEGDLTQAVEQARRAVAADPAREELHLALMRLYAAMGQTASALRQYEQCRKVVEDQWGDAPSEALRACAAEVRQQALVPAEIRTPPVRKAGAISPLPAGTITVWCIGWNPAVSGLERLTEYADEIAAQGGITLYSSEQESVLAFASAQNALNCVLACLRRFFQQEHATAEPLSALPHAFSQQENAFFLQGNKERSEPQRFPGRMALYTGDAPSAKMGGGIPLEADGFRVKQVARRLLLFAHPGQVLCGEVTAALLLQNGKPAIRLRPQGIYRAGAVPERLFQVDMPEAPATLFPPLSAEQEQTFALPPTPTRFFGRETELARLCALLKQEEAASLEAANPTVLVTLTGPGGTGKTRLALEVAKRLQTDGLCTVCFVSLADVMEARFLPEAVRDSLSLPRLAGVDPMEQVSETLRNQPMALILDNYEHLVETGAEFVTLLQQRVPFLRCLITSRQQLGLIGEQEFPLSPLPTPEPSPAAPERRLPASLLQYPCVQLFVDRAQAARPDFQLTHSNALAVAALCHRLEGVPLAIELAAARISVLSPAQILGHLAHRLDFLTARQRDRTPRHRTLRAAIDWSYQLLSPAQQRLFARLSLFAGGWTVDAVEAVCQEAAALDCLLDLRERSLIVPAEGECEPPRFRMLETLRDYAQEQCSPEDRETLMPRYAAYYLERSVQSRDSSNTPDESDLHVRLSADHDNLRAALTWLLMHRSLDALHMARNLIRYWYVRGHLQEGLEWLTAALHAAEEAPDAIRASALNGAGIMARDLGDYERATGSCETALHLYRRLAQTQGIAVSLHNLGLIAHDRGDLLTGAALYRESLALKREVGDRPGIGLTLCSLAGLCVDRGAYDQAIPFAQEGLELFRSLGDRWGIAVALNYLGTACRGQKEYLQAIAYQSESLETARSIGNRRGIALACLGLGMNWLELQDITQARPVLRESLNQFAELHDAWGMAYSLSLMAELAVHIGQPIVAARLCGAAQTQWEALSHSPASEEHQRLNRLRQPLQETLGLPVFTAHHAAGRALLPSQALAEALAV